MLCLYLPLLVLASTVPVSGKTSCSVRPMRLHVLVDISGGIAFPGGEATLKTFIANLMHEFDSDNVQRILSTFSNTVQVLYMDDTAVVLDDVLDNLVLNGTSTNTAAALDYIRDNFITGYSGCTVIVIVTDGMSKDYAETKMIATGILDDFDVSFCVVTVGRSSCEGVAEINHLAGDSGDVIQSLINPEAAAAAAASCVCDKCATEEQTTTTTNSDSGDNNNFILFSTDTTVTAYLVQSNGDVEFLNMNTSVNFAASDGQAVFFTGLGVHRYDGQDVTQLQAFNGDLTVSIALDTNEQRIFVWVQGTGVNSMGYDGIEQLVVSAGHDNYGNGLGMAVDENTKTVYYTEIISGTLSKVSYTVSPSAPEVVVSGISSGTGLTFDAGNNVLYAISFSSTIYMIDMNADTPVLEVAISASSNTNTKCYGMILHEDMFYYTDAGAKTIWRISSTADDGDDRIRHTNDFVGSLPYGMTIYNI